MAHHNTVRRYPPVDYYDVVAVDRWLERMALNSTTAPMWPVWSMTGRESWAAFPPAPPGGLLGIRTCV